MRRILPSSDVECSARCCGESPGAAAVADPDVEHAVGAEHEVAAVVVRERVVRDQQGAGVGSRRSRRCPSSCTRRCGCCRSCRCSRRRAWCRRARTRGRAGPVRCRSRAGEREHRAHDLAVRDDHDLAGLLGDVDAARGHRFATRTRRVGQTGRDRDGLHVRQREVGRGRRGRRVWPPAPAPGTAAGADCRRDRRARCRRGQDARDDARSAPGPPPPHGAEPTSGPARVDNGRTRLPGPRTERHARECDTQDRMQWSRLIAGVALGAVGAVWFAQGSGRAQGLVHDGRAVLGRSSARRCSSTGVYLVVTSARRGRWSLSATIATA